MSGMTDFREKHPEYNDLSDVVLADKLHAKYYADVPKDQYYQKLGVSTEPSAPLSGGGSLPANPKREPQTAWEHITSAAGSAFDEPLGPSEETLKPFVSGPSGLLNTANRALLQGGGTALDVLSRPVEAGVRGLAAAGGLALGDKPERSGPGPAERDLYAMGQMAQIALGMGATPGALPRAIEGGGETLAGRMARGEVPPEKVHQFARWYLEPDDAALDRAVSLGERGYRSSPLSYAEKAPGLGQMWVVADRFGVNPIPKEAERFYREGATGILKAQGEDVPSPREVTSPTTKVSFEPAGQAIRQKVVAQYQAESSELEAARAKVEQSRINGLATAQADLENLKARHAKYQAARDAAIKQDLAALDGLGERVHITSDPARAGELSRQIADTIAKYDDDAQKAFGREAETAYSMAGGERRYAAPVVEPIKALYASMPDPIKDMAPSIVRKYASTEGKTTSAPVFDAHGVHVGESAITAPPTMSFEEAHQALKWARDAAKFQAISSGVRAGAKNRVVGLLDNFLHDQSEHVPAAWKEASGVIKEANQDYKGVRDQLKTAVVKNLAKDYKNSAAARNPITLARMIFRNDNAVAAETARGIMGPELFNQVVLADLRDALNGSRDARGELVDTKLADQLNMRRLNGTLDMWKSPEVRRLAAEFTERVQKRDGKLAVLPSESDSFSDVLRKFNEADARLQEYVKHDPMTAFNEGFREMEADFAGSKKMLDAQQQADPFAVFAADNAKVAEAAKAITRDEHRLTEFAQRFPEAEGPQLAYLRRAFWKDFLQRDFFDESGRPSKKVTGLQGELSRTLTDRMVDILAPGQTKQSVYEFASDVKHLLKSENDIAFSLQAGSAVKNPAGMLPFPKGLGWVKRVPAFMLRPVLAKYLEKITDYASDPAFHQWMKYGMNGPPEAQAAVRGFLDRIDSEVRYAGPSMRLAWRIGEKSLQSASDAKAGAKKVASSLGKPRAPISDSAKSALRHIYQAGSRAADTSASRVLSTLGVRGGEDDQETR